MAAKVRSYISDTLIIQACNTEHGTGGVARWTTNFAQRVKRQAIATAPVSNPKDRLHRPNDPGGTYKASFRLDKSKNFGNQHVIRREVGNTADHAFFVEFGKAPSAKQQYYSSKGHNHPGGEPSWHDFAGGWDGQHILDNAFNSTIRANARYLAKGSYKKITIRG